MAVEACVLSLVNKEENSRQARIKIVGKVKLFLVWPVG